MPQIALKRAYEAALPADGVRFLVERLWPRGVSKANLKIDAWLKDVAPSAALRKWFSHDPEKWTEFRRRYFRELRLQPEARGRITSAAHRGQVTLVYSSGDRLHNNAVALQEYLLRRVPRRTNRRKPAAHSAHKGRGRRRTTRER